MPMKAMKPMVDAVNRLIVDKNLRQQMSMAAKSYVREFHDLNNNYQELELSLRAIVNSRKKKLQNQSEPKKIH